MGEHAAAQMLLAALDHVQILYGLPPSGRGLLSVYLCNLIRHGRGYSNKLKF